MGEVVKFMLYNRIEAVKHKNIEALRYVLKHINKSDLLVFGKLNVLLDYDVERDMIEKTTIKKDDSNNVIETIKEDYKSTLDMYLPITIDYQDKAFLVYLDVITEEFAVYKEKYIAFVEEERLKNRPNNVIPFRR